MREEPAALLCFQHVPGDILAQQARRTFQQGIISQADHDLAWRETKRLLQEIEQGTFSVLTLGTQHREALLQVVKPASTDF